jgi:hypothetical protein
MSLNLCPPPKRLSVEHQGRISRQIVRRGAIRTKSKTVPPPPFLASLPGRLLRTHEHMSLVPVSVSGAENKESPRQPATTATHHLLTKPVSQLAPPPLISLVSLPL